MEAKVSLVLTGALLDVSLGVVFKGPPAGNPPLSIARHYYFATSAMAVRVVRTFHLAFLVYFE